MPSASNPLVFIVGCPRSGTTLLERMVNAHPQVAIIHESQWLTRFYVKRIGMDRNGLVKPDIVDALSGHHRFKNLRMTRQDLKQILDADAQLTYPRFVTQVFELYGRREGKPWVGDKSTGGYVRHLDTLHELFPDARIVHLIRDGREVCLSMLDWPKAQRAAGRLPIWRESPAATTALWWKWHVRLGRDAGARIGPRYRELRYDRLVRDPAAELADLCAFLGIPADSSMLEFNQGRVRPNDSSLSPNQAWLSPTTGLRDWREHMRPEDLQLFEALADDLLIELGYELSNETPSSATIEAAERFRGWWRSHHDLPDATDKKSHVMRSDESRTPPAGRNPYVFVVGCPRSGTTLLQRMLDSHPRLAVANDTHFIPRVLHKAGLEGNPALTPDLVEQVRSYRRFPRLGLPDGAVERAAGRAGAYADFISALYDEFADLHDKPFGGEKTPDYARNLPMLSELFPQARFVHIVRDGRDVALSTLQWANENKGPGRLALWNEEPVATCALWWKRNVSCGCTDGAQMGSSRYFELRYEDLVDSPEPILRRLATFLGLDFDTRMITFHEGKTRPGRSAKSAWLPVTTGLRDWRTQMPERDVELFEALAGDLLAELGYERATAPTSPAVRRVADRCRDWWHDRKWDRDSGSREAAAANE